MHLAAVANAAHTTIMRDKCHPPWPSRATKQSQTPCNDGPYSVSAHDNPRGNVAHAKFVTHAYAARATASITCDVSNSDALVHARPRYARAIEHDLVEQFTSERESAVTKSVKSMTRCKPPFESLTTRCADHHTSKLGGPGAFDGIERAHVCQNSRRLRTEILGARFRTWKVRAIKHQHIHPIARQRPRGGRTSGTSADNHNIRAGDVPGRHL